jgi:hypothetical protein
MDSSALDKDSKKQNEYQFHSSHHSIENTKLEEERTKILVEMETVEIKADDLGIKYCNK